MELVMAALIGLMAGVSAYLMMAGNLLRFLIGLSLLSNAVNLAIFEAGRLSFASPERLMKYLGVVAGAVSPFALVNDTQGQVRVVFDRAVLAGDPVNLHPLDNALSTAIAAADLRRFLEAIEHPPLVVDLP